MCEHLIRCLLRASDSVSLIVRVQGPSEQDFQAEPETLPGEDL